jgi:hypothetical protein
VRFHLTQKIKLVIYSLDTVTLIRLTNADYNMESLRHRYIQIDKHFWLSHLERTLINPHCQDLVVTKENWNAIKHRLIEVWPYLNQKSEHRFLLILLALTYLVKHLKILTMLE